MKPLFVHLTQHASTNDFALHWLKEAQSGEVLVVTTDAQTQGRGQRGNDWSHEPGLDLAWSWAMKWSHSSPPSETAAPFLFNKAIAVGVGDALASLLPTHVDVGIKWPNDVVLRGPGTENRWRKCAGLLIENTWRGSRWDGVVVGIGINVNSNRLHQARRASLRDLNGAPCDVQGLSNALEAACTAAARTPIDAETIDGRYRHRLIGRTDWTRFTYMGSTGMGRVSSVDEQGRLILLWKPDGTAETGAPLTLTVTDSRSLDWTALLG